VLLNAVGQLTQVGYLVLFKTGSRKIRLPNHTKNMATIVKIQRKGQMTLPSRLREEVGVKEGDVVEASVKDGKIVLTPAVVIDRSKFPTADDDYTPAQRKKINAQLAKAIEDVKKGRTYGPFNTADEMIASMKHELKKRGARKKLKPTR
jgi:AbrB family looped-hinge helix DNA binding protein